MKGIITNIASVACTVDTEEGTFLCAARGRLTESDSGQKKPLVVGDRVEIEVTDPGEGVVTEVFPRRTRLSRTNPRDPHTEHIIVANVDQVLIVSAVREPPLSVGLIDRYIIASLYGGMEPMVCINKIDLAGQPSECREVARTYREIGYRVLLTSAETGEGLDELKENLRAKSTVLAGHSGVGKSSLINALQPGLELETAPLGWKGTHCTSSVSLLKLEFGGYVVDTPGVREVNPWDIEKKEVAQFFPEIWERSHDCKMPDCTHLHEPDCAVQEALEAGEIAPWRYESYANIVESIEEQDEPRKTDVDDARRQVSRSQRRPSRRRRKQRLRDQLEEGIEKWREGEY